MEEQASVRYSVALTKDGRLSALSGEASKSAERQGLSVFGSCTVRSHEYVSHGGLSKGISQTYHHTDI